MQLYHHQSTIHAFFDMVFWWHFFRLFGEPGAKSAILGPVGAQLGPKWHPKLAKWRQNAPLKFPALPPKATSETDFVRRGSLGDLFVTFCPAWLHFGSFFTNHKILLASLRKCIKNASLLHVQLLHGVNICCPTFSIVVCVLQFPAQLSQKIMWYFNRSKLHLSAFFLQDQAHYINNMQIDVIK